MGAPRNVVEAARRAVIQRFPDMAGMRCSSEAAPVPGKYIVTARSSASTSDGKKLQRIVRVTVDDRGQVLRLSTSK